MNSERVVVHIVHDALIIKCPNIGSTMTRLSSLLLLSLFSVSIAHAESPATQPATTQPTSTKAASTAALKVGDAAPAFSPGKWLNGDPIKTLDPQKVYLVEFWATWCGPCKAQIPHLNELHKQFSSKGLVVIGQNVWETDQKLPEPFVQEMGEKMSYRIALDEQTGKQSFMATHWLIPAGIRSIPASFLIDKQGKIAWIGHPADLTEAMITALLDDKFADAGAKQAVDQEKSRAALRTTLTAFEQALRANDFDKAEAAIASGEKEIVGQSAIVVSSLRIELAVAKGDNDGAAAIAKKLAEQYSKDLSALHMIASRLSKADKPSPAMLDAAIAISTTANEAMNGKDVAALIILARANFLQGHTDKAIEFQQKALDLSKAAAKPRMQSFLDSYKAGKLPDEKARR